MNEFHISDNAVNDISRLLSKEEVSESLFLRVKVIPGGCSGFSYEMGFDDVFDTSDNIFYSESKDSSERIKVVIDKFSFNHVNGGTLNFSDGLNSTGFNIENPNAIASCGCGTSFTV
jgi:iron-sulfur cluster assembly accessory protein